MITVQFPAILIRMSEKAIYVWCHDAGAVWLPFSQVVKYTPMECVLPVRPLWMSVTPWVANKKRIYDARPVGER